MEMPFGGRGPLDRKTPDAVWREGWGEGDGGARRADDAEIVGGEEPGGDADAQQADDPDDEPHREQESRPAERQWRQRFRNVICRHAGRVPGPGSVVKIFSGR